MNEIPVNNIWAQAAVPQVPPQTPTPQAASAPLVEYVRSTNGLNLFTLRSTKGMNAWGDKPTLLVVSTGSIFNCCGARTAYGMDSVFNVEDKDQHRQKAEFLQQYLTNVGGNQYTLYCIATSAQMEIYRDNPRSVLHLLFELGAEVVFKSPNHVHGPNDLHIIVWQPKIHTKLLNKYVTYNSRTWRWEIVPEPKQTEMFPETVKAVSPVSDSSKPLRDALGRFARKVIV